MPGCDNLLAAEGSAEHIKGIIGAYGSDAAAVTALSEMERMDVAALLAGESHKNRANFVNAVSVRTCNSRNTYAEIGIKSFADVFRKGNCNLGRINAFFLDKLIGDAQKNILGVIGINGAAAAKYRA